MLLLILGATTLELKSQTWPQQAQNASRPSAQWDASVRLGTGMVSHQQVVADRGDVVQGNALVMDATNAYWSSGTGVLRALNLVSGAFV